MAGDCKAAAKLQRRGALINPRHGFYVVVPPQFLSWRAPPPSWYIDELMRHEGRPYYVGLLKAAELHGATHRAVMEFQIVTSKRMPKIRAGRSIVSFFYRKGMERVGDAVTDHKTDTGRMKISSPELTALDLLRYAHAAGAIDSIATVLSDLGGKMHPEKLAELAPAFERTVIQRLGYLLDHLRQADCAAVLHEHLQKSKPLPWVELEPNRRRTKFAEPLERNSRWNVMVRRLRSSTNDSGDEHRRLGTDNSVGRAKAGRTGPCHQPRVGRNICDPPMLVASSRAQSPLTSRSCSRRSSILSSTPRRPGCSASPCHRRCSPSPTR